MQANAYTIVEKGKGLYEAESIDFETWLHLCYSPSRWTMLRLGNVRRKRIINNRRIQR